MKDKRAFIFYFLMSIIFFDFANQLKVLSFNPYLLNYKNSIFSIIHMNNTGGAFSLLENNAQILAVIGIIAIILITYYVYKKVTFNDKLLLLSLTLFVSGAFGNMYERIKFGYVIDYIKLNFIDFPVFNTFDIMISIGVVLYILFILFTKEQKITPKKDKIEDDKNSNNK